MAQERNLYQIWLKYVGIPAVIVFLFGLIFPTLRDAIFSPEAAEEVLIQAIPFLAVFITIILLFILLIAFVAIRLHKTITHRTHRAIEVTLVVGILISLFSMFQSINIVGYNYGFLLLLGALLSFILWTHVTPRASSIDEGMSAFTQRETTIGLIAGALSAILILSIFISTAQPQAPYGLRQRQWDSYDEDRQAEISGQALSEFQSIQIPYFIILSLIPGALAFFIAREIAAPNAAEQMARAEKTVHKVETH